MAKLLSISFPIFFTSNLNRADKAACDKPACDPKTNPICPAISASSRKLLINFEDGSFVLTASAA